MHDGKRFLRYLEDRLSSKSADLYYRAAVQGVETDDPLELVRDEDLGGSRRDTFRKALRHYARWRGDTELDAALRTVKVPGRWTRKRVVQALSMDEWKRLKDAIRNGEHGTMKAALLLLCSSGLRISELLTISRATLEEAVGEGKAVTYQKGQKLRWYVIGTEEQWESSSVLLDQMKGEVDQVWKVLAESTGKNTVESIGQSLRYGLNQAAKRAGLKKVNPHMLRRVAGDAVRIASGGDMKVVQDFLGHQSLKTTIEWYQDHAHPEEVAAALGRIEE